jgi:phenylalanine-4-hydroxylase
MRTPYRIDDYQQTYFVVDSFEDLLHQTLDRDFAPIYAAMDAKQDLAITDILPNDTVFTRGTQDYALGQPA